MILHRPGRFGGDAQEDNVLEVHVAKQRNGPIGKVDLVFLHHLTKFENRAEDLGETQEAESS